MHRAGLSDRQFRIVELLETGGKMSVNELAEHFNVTPTTIRRELIQLEAEDLIRRSHGYAQTVDRKDNQPISTFEYRRHSREAEKRLIAKRAMEYIKPCDTIIIDSGTTNLALAEALAETEIPELSIVTNSLPVANVLAYKYRVAMTGGIIDSTTMCLIGHDAESYFDNVSADKVFLGTTGINTAAGLTVISPFHYNVKRKMMQSASKVIVLADSAKFKSGGFNVVCSFEPLDVIITVRNESNSDDMDVLQEKGVKFDCI